MNCLVTGSSSDEDSTWMINNFAAIFKNTETKL